MNQVETFMETLALETTFGEALGPHAVLAFIALAGVLMGATFAVLMRSVWEQRRGPRVLQRAALLEGSGSPDGEPAPQPTAS